MNKSAAQRWVIVYPTTPMFLRVRCNEKPRPDGVPMSLPGTERTYRDVGYLVAFGCKADISQPLLNKRNLWVHALDHGLSAGVAQRENA
jgi:hypothetical protein